MTTFVQVKSVFQICHIEKTNIYGESLAREWVLTGPNQRTRHGAGQSIWKLVRWPLVILAGVNGEPTRWRFLSPYSDRGGSERSHQLRETSNVNL